MGRSSRRASWGANMLCATGVTTKESSTSAPSHVPIASAKTSRNMRRTRDYAASDGAVNQRAATMDASHVIAQHELLRVRIEIDLPREIRHVQTPDVVPHQGERDDERDEPPAVI